MEIESLRLDFQSYKYQKIAQNISEKNPEKEEKKKTRNKERRTQAVVPDPGRAPRLGLHLGRARRLGFAGPKSRARPKQRAAQAIARGLGFFHPSRLLIIDPFNKVLSPS